MPLNPSSHSVCKGAEGSVYASAPTCVLSSCFESLRICPRTILFPPLNLNNPLAMLLNDSCGHSLRISEVPSLQDPQKHTRMAFSHDTPRQTSLAGRGVSTKWTRYCSIAQNLLFCRTSRVLHRLTHEIFDCIVVNSRAVV
jgi:hypothetical protein